MTPLLLQPTTTPHPTRCFTHQATSTDPSVATVLLMWDSQQESFVAELYDSPSPQEREAAFLVIGLDQPCHTVEDLEDQLGDRIQPLRLGVRMALSNDALADLCSRLQWQFIPGLQPALSAVISISNEALQSYQLTQFETDEWGRDHLVRLFYGHQLECFREELPTSPNGYQYRFVITL